MIGLPTVLVQNSFNWSLLKLCLLASTRIKPNCLGLAYGDDASDSNGCSTSCNGMTGANCAADDQIPVVASACELYPGKTSFQRYSESECGFTSAVGRALAYAGFSGNKSLASLDEITSAKGRQPVAQLASVIPLHDVEQPFESEASSPYASPKQLGLIRVLASKQSLSNDQLKEFCTNTVGRPIMSSKELTKAEVSKVIDALKLSEPT